jgi:lysophospholipase L1-like esterase
VASRLLNAERHVAVETDSAFWSAFNAMDGSGSIDSWLNRGLAQADRIHFTGDGYALLAKMFYEDYKTCLALAR